MSCNIWKSMPSQSTPSISGNSKQTFLLWDSTNAMFNDAGDKISRLAAIFKKDITPRLLHVPPAVVDGGYQTAAPHWRLCVLAVLCAVRREKNISLRLCTRNTLQHVTLALYYDQIPRYI